MRFGLAAGASVSRTTFSRTIENMRYSPKGRRHAGVHEGPLQIHGLIRIGATGICRAAKSRREATLSWRIRARWIWASLPRLCAFFGRSLGSLLFHAVGL